jgi:hypothetical protein
MFFMNHFLENVFHQTYFPTLSNDGSQVGPEKVPVGSEQVLCESRGVPSRSDLVLVKSWVGPNEVLSRSGQVSDKSRSSPDGITNRFRVSPKQVQSDTR